MPHRQVHVDSLLHTASQQSVSPSAHVRTPAMCQRSFDMSAQLRSGSCTSNCRLGNLSALAVAGQLSCSLSAWLPRSQSTSNCQLRCTSSALLHVFSPSAISWLGCSQSALLHNVTSFAALPCIMSVQLRSVSSAVSCQLSCNLSALAYSVMQLICSDRPAERHQLSYEV